VVAADPHLTPDGSGTWKVLHRTRARLETAVRVADALSPDAVLLLGDLTRHGHPDEYALAETVLSDLDAPLVALPGNHDVPKWWDDYDAPDATAFARRFGADGYPHHRRVGGLDLVALDSASGDGDLYRSHEGRVTDAQRDWLRRHLPALSNPVVALHHPVLHPTDHVGEFPAADFYHLRDAAALRDLLAAHDVPLALSAHLHWPATARVDGLRELVAPAVCSFPQSMLLLDVDRHGTTVRLVPLADRAATAEAYSHAASGAAHGQGIATLADRGGLSAFPLVDEAGPERVVADGRGDSSE
jgi:3',5'-cyclic AMP phosphodiesterase CpdA